MRIPPSLLAAVLLGSSDGQLLAGPYVIDVEHAEPCPSKLLDRPFPLTVGVTRYRHNPLEKYFGGDFTTSDTFDDSVNGSMELASWSSRGGWKENALVMKFKRVCASFNTYLPDVWNHVRSHLYGPSGLVTDCPIPPGSYSLHNLSTSMQSMPIPALFYGRWRLDARAFHKDKCFMCVRAIGRVNPKVPPSSQG